MNTGEISINEISEILGVSYEGKNYIIDGLNLVNRETLKTSIISYLTSDKYAKYLNKNVKIKSLLVTKEIFHAIFNKYNNITYFIVDNPEVTFYKLHQYLIKNTVFYDKYHFPKRIGLGCEIHKTVVCEDGVTIGNNVKIGYRSVIRKGSTIEDNSTIGVGCIIGSEGFQIIQDDDGNNQLIIHAGGCHISSDVHIGDNSTICNSLFEGHTLIGKNTKIDNLVHIAHNCKIGDNCIITAGVILSGTTIINDNVWVAPNATILNRVVLDNNSKIGIGAVVLKNVPAGSTVVGNPAKVI